MSRRSTRVLLKTAERLLLSISEPSKKRIICEALERFRDGGRLASALAACDEPLSVLAYWDPGHPANAARHWVAGNPSRVRMRDFLEVNGTAPDLTELCRDYAEQLRAADPQLCLLGIGENGHLAFNDPGEADFKDPVDVKIVHLDAVCRQQQFAEGWFNTFQEVPEEAITLTIPTLLRVSKLIVSVPGARKARIMRCTLQEPISTECPSTILRTHADATVYLDRESAAELNGLALAG